MRPRELWRATAFRLALAFGAAYVAGIALLLGLVYLATADYLSRRVDGILHAEAAHLERTGPEAIIAGVAQERRRDPLNAFALFAADGGRIAGSSPIPEGALPAGGPARDLRPSGRSPVRALETRLPWGETLIVSRDLGQVAELQRVLVGALAASGALICVIGLASGVLLSRGPLRRVHAIREASERIVSGQLSERLPVSARGDEVDLLARIVNDMLDEVMRLLLHAQSAGEGVAHELRTPLTRLQTGLERAAADLPPDDPARARLEACVAEAQGVLERFQGLLRIAAVEAKRRRARVDLIDLSGLVEQLFDLYRPLAEERRLRLDGNIAPGLAARADKDLLFEAAANLLDNALKFTPAGGAVRLKLERLGPKGAALEVSDDGPGVPAAELDLLTERFFRSPGHHSTEGHGLGLSLVAAVARLHGHRLSFRTGTPGLTARLEIPDAAPPPA